LLHQVGISNFLTVLCLLPVVKLHPMTRKESLASSSLVLLNSPFYTLIIYFRSINGSSKLQKAYVNYPNHLLGYIKQQTLEYNPEEMQIWYHPNKCLGAHRYTILLRMSIFPPLCIPLIANAVFRKNFNFLSRFLALLVNSPDSHGPCPTFSPSLTIYSNMVFK